MEIIFTDHAKKQLRERKLSLILAATSIKNPTLIKRQKDGRFQFIKLIRQNAKKYLLISVAERSPNIITIITIFKTSKIKKYL